MAETMKYAQRLGQNKEQKEEGARAQNVERAKLSLDSTILDTQQSVQNSDAKLNELLGEFPVRWDLVVDAQRNREIAQDNLERLQNLRSELF